MIFARYMGREFLKVNIFIIGIFLMMYCIIDFLEMNTRYFPRHDASAAVIVEFYATQIPKMLVDMLPFSVMFSTIVVLWMFARSGEIAALRAAGQSVFRICRPLMLLGLALSVVSFLLSELVVPRSMLHLQKVRTVKIEKQTLDRIFLESNWVRGDSSVLHFKNLNQLRQSLEGPEYFVFRSPSAIKEVVYAERAKFDGAKGVWILENALVTTFDADGRPRMSTARLTYPTTVNSQPPRLLKTGVTSDQISYVDLRDLIQQSRVAGGAIAEREVDLYQKLSLPFANFLFVFLAMPFALRRERQTDTYIGIVLCLIVAIVYSVGNLSMRSLAQNGVVNPIVAAWAMTVFLCSTCFFVVHKLDRGQ